MTEEKENNQKINPDTLKRIICGLAGFIIIALVFGVGVFVGETKARFSYRWAENYHQNFAGPRAGFMGKSLPAPFAPNDFIESRGDVGEIIKINDTDFVIKSRDNVEKVIVIGEKTIIEKGKTTIKKEDLAVGDLAVIIGSPNDQGQIEAKLIRIFDKKL